MSPITQDLDGFWETEGYGFVLDICDNKLNIYEITSISCFKIESIGDFIKSLPIDINDIKDRITLEINDNGNLIFEIKGTTIRYTTNRIKHLPLQCQKIQEKVLMMK